ncbi:hypothetical protein LTR94_034909, partial [Friedmanniomyces endolithicus]
MAPTRRFRMTDPLPAPPPSLRPATVADAPAIAALARKTFTDTFGHLYSPENLAAFLSIHTPENWAAEIADPAYC